MDTVVAGTTALSRGSMLADDHVPTYAMRDRDLTTGMDKGEIFGCGNGLVGGDVGFAQG